MNGISSRLVVVVVVVEPIHCLRLTFAFYLMLCNTDFTGTSWLASDCRVHESFVFCIWSFVFCFLSFVFCFVPKHATSIVNLQSSIPNLVKIGGFQG